MSESRQNYGLSPNVVHPSPVPTPYPTGQHSVALMANHTIVLTPASGGWLLTTTLSCCRVSRNNRTVHVLEKEHSIFCLFAYYYYHYYYYYYDYYYHNYMVGG